MRRRQKHTSEPQRDDSDVATDSEVLRSFIKKPKPYAPIVTAPHLPTFDLRTYHPDPITRPIAEPRSASRLVPSKGAVSVGGPSRTAVGNSRTGTLPHRLQFAAPKQVAVCIRRKTRRQVLFAKNRYRKGSYSKRKHSQWSSVTC